LLDRCPELFVGRFGILYSNADTAIDAYAEDPQGPYEIDVVALRKELARVATAMDEEISTSAS
jgi:hypothetical protein